MLLFKEFELFSSLWLYEVDFGLSDEALFPRSHKKKKEKKENIAFHT